MVVVKRPLQIRDSHNKGGMVVSPALVAPDFPLPSIWDAI
jgi:hypothetical protein